MFPWLEQVEAAAEDIRAEFLAAFTDDADKLEPYVADPKMSHWRELNYSKRWSVYPLWRDGTTYPEHIARCPKTVAAVEACPRWNMPGNGPTALFSILDAKAHIPGHTGAVNTRLLCHLALVVPPGCRFRVGGQTREWVEGKAFVFDDTINHEAWNDSDVSRAVLIFDVWSPFLSEAERELVRALTVRIGEFYGSAASTRGRDLREPPPDGQARS
jgi:aspartyl/asparaginyl beta-hydroxylase (cupin superfamily)